MEQATKITSNEVFLDYPDVVSVEDISHMLNICKVKAYDLVRSGQIHGVKIGHVYRIPKKAVSQFLETS